MIPKHLWKGSQGPAVVLLQLWFLVSWQKIGEGMAASWNLVPDGSWNDTWIRILRAYQRSHEIPDTDDFDEATRNYLKRYERFDWETAVRAVGGRTAFVQPDGSTEYFSQEGTATPKPGDDAGLPLLNPGETAW